MRLKAIFPMLLAAPTLACGSNHPAPEGPVGPAAPTTTGAEAPPPKEAENGGMKVSGNFLPPMPQAVTSFGAAMDTEHLYVMGGYFGEPHKYSREYQSNKVWRLDLDTGTWAEIGQLEQGSLQGVAAVYHDGQVCRFGGNRLLNEEGTDAAMMSVAEASCLDTTTRTWTDLPPMPEGRSSHEVAMIDSTVYVAGGWRMGDEHGPSGAADARWATTVYALDLAADAPKWEVIDAPTKRRAVGVAAAGDKLVVFGGLTPGRKMAKQTEVYDPATKAWSQGPEYPAPAFGADAVGMGDAVYASAADGVVYRWRMGTSEWQRAATHSFPRFFHQLVPGADGSSLVAIGGIGGMHNDGRTKHVEVIPLSADAGRLSTVTIPYPGQAKNRQGVFLHGDHLFLFGGNDSLGQHDFEPENFLDQGWRFHVPSMTWQRTAAYPAHRQTMQTVVVGERGISVGGFGHDGEHPVAWPQTFAFDFEEETWSPLSELPRGRTQFGLAHHEDTLWVFGGLNYDPRRKGAKAFDHVTNTLMATIIAPAKTSNQGRASKGKSALAGADETPPFVDHEPAFLPGPRRAFAGAAYDGKYYVVGGMKEGFALVEDCLVYDFESKTFGPMACPDHPRLSGQLIPLDDKLYLVGGAFKGAGGMESDRTIEVFDPKTSTWSRLPVTIPHDTKHSRVMAYHHRLLVFSTHLETPEARITVIDPVGATP